MENIKAKIVLVGGSSSMTMAKKTCELCTRKPHVAILPTARGDDPEIIEETYGFYSRFAESVDVIKLIAETPDKEDIKARFKKADLIYMPGGATENIKKAFAKYGAEKFLFDAVMTEGKVIVGSSAGAMVLSHSCVEVDCGEVYANGYEIIPAYFAPHYQLPDWKGFDAFLESKTEPAIGFAAGDDAGVLCTPDGRYYTFFGEEGNPVWRFVYNKDNGRWDRTEYLPDETVDITP
ncbi:MAG: hypothetical protein E7652_02855 [Ruminococcaceae bacterium]|nr:hypothetical protein [Oscillospiraceae bacterium]